MKVIYATLLVFASSHASASCEDLPSMGAIRACLQDQAQQSSVDAKNKLITALKMQDESRAADFIESQKKLDEYAALFCSAISKMQRGYEQDNIHNCKVDILSVNEKRIQSALKKQ